MSESILVLEINVYWDRMISILFVFVINESYIAVTEIDFLIYFYVML